MSEGQVLFLPAGMVTSGYGVPAVCNRHGQPAVLRRQAIFQSRPPRWSYALLLAGALPFVLVSMALRKRLTAAGWPFCARCQSTIRGCKLGALLLILAAFAAVLGGVVLAQHANSLAPAALFAALIFFLAGLIVFGLAAPGKVARAEVTADGFALRLRRTAPEFRAALPAMPPAPQYGQPMAPMQPGWGPPNPPPPWGQQPGWGPPPPPPPQGGPPPWQREG